MNSADLLAAARHRLEQAHQAQPDDRQVLSDLSKLLQNMNAYAALTRIIDKAIQRSPDDIKLLVYRCEIHNNQGEFSQAKSLYRQILQREPENHSALIGMVMQGCGEEIGGLERVEGRLARGGLTQKQHCSLGYARARLLEQQSRFDEAFEVYREVNALSAARGGMDIAAKQRGARMVIEDIPADVLDRIKGVGNTSERPIFIVGMPRSGSTLTEQILASHSRVYGGGEMPFWNLLMSQLVGAVPRHSASVVEAIDSLDPLIWTNTGNEYLARCEEIDKTALRMTDKLPSNYGLLPLLRLVFPRAHIIHVKREPLATLASCIRTDFRDPTLAFSVEDWGRFYGIYQALIECWKPIIGDQMLEVVYEDLVNDLPTQARRLIEFVGLEWEEACLHPEQSKRPVRTASVQQVRKPIYTQSISAWQRYIDQLEAIRPCIAESRSAVLQPANGTAR